MTEFTPLQQARRNALGALVNMLKMEYELLALDFADNANDPESVSDEEWTGLVKSFGRARLAFLTRDMAMMLQDPQGYVAMVNEILADTARDIAAMTAGETKQ